MRPVFAGMLAGLIATAVLSIVMVLNAALGWLPELSVIGLLAEVSAQVFGTPRNLFVGWIEHLLIGTVLWGTLFALTNSLWWRNQVFRGIQFALIAWLLMMTFLMPLANLGMFGAALGPEPAVATLILHLIYGAVLGYYYGRMLSPVITVRHPPGEEARHSPAQPRQRRRVLHQR